MGLYAVDIIFDCYDTTGQHDLRQAWGRHEDRSGRIQIMDAFIGYCSGLPEPPSLIRIGPGLVMRDAYTDEVYAPPAEADQSEFATIRISDTWYDLVIRHLGEGEVDLLVYDYGTGPDE